MLLNSQVSLLFFVQGRSHDIRLQHCFSKCGPRWTASGFGREIIAKIVSDIERMKNTTIMSVLKLPSLVYLQKKVRRLVISIASCPSIIILENISNQCIEKNVVMVTLNAGIYPTQLHALLCGDNFSKAIRICADRL
jgi:hypothetical protein